MLKKFSMILLAMLLVTGLAFVGCSDDDDDLQDAEPGTVIASVTNQTFTIAATAYGDHGGGADFRGPGIEGFQLVLGNEVFRYGYHLQEGVVYTLDIEFTLGRTVTEDMQIGLFTIASNHDWIQLSWDPDVDDSMNIIAVDRLTGIVEASITFIPLTGGVVAGPDGIGLNSNIAILIDEVQAGTWRNRTSSDPGWEDWMAGFDQTGQPWMWVYDGYDEIGITIHSLTLTAAE